MDVWVEPLPPISSVAMGPVQNQSVPSTVAFNFSSISGSGSGIPMSTSLCRMVQLSTAVSQQDAGAPSGSVSLPGNNFNPLQGLRLSLLICYLEVYLGPCLKACGSMEQAWLKVHI